ncbi:MAG TPA: dihydrofolate reductase [Pseudolabrys sp.]|nr:dihydrofolate reductase [Pseudolabrys sp.]
MPSQPIIEGYAIVSEDGMLANAQGIMPDTLKFEADHRFFEAGLDGCDLVVHGRHSREEHARSAARRRLIVTRRGAGLEAATDDPQVFYWNPAGMPFDEALKAFATPVTRAGIIGGTEVFGLFLGRYDAFFLTRGPRVRLEGGRPVFPGVPALTPEQVLGGAGLVADKPLILDAVNGIAVVAWRRAHGQA